ncbi:unnamed protein product [Linum tenue]|uniref:Uncharacterized protein n=1 Tax=Linum tenue TaxID=586396 RepID=A0AAV0KQW8_9ROSI|nr:unnamed protein product [Linum tenue]
MSPRASAATTEAAGDEDHRRETFHDLPPPPPRGAPAGSSGIIDSIVSHLPKSLPEDVAPTNDEASILIHAIVHD